MESFHYEVYRHDLTILVAPMLLKEKTIVYSERKHKQNMS